MSDAVGLENKVHHKVYHEVYHGMGTIKDSITNVRYTVLGTMFYNNEMKM